jgi:hypothetical protein
MRSRVGRPVIERACASVVASFAAGVAWWKSGECQRVKVAAVQSSSRDRSSNGLPLFAPARASPRSMRCARALRRGRRCAAHSLRRRRRAQNTNAEKRVADSRTRFNRSSARQTRRGSRRSIRFAKLVLERIAPFPTGVRIATFRRATPTRCGASWQAMNVGCCGSAPPTSVKRCGGRLPPMAQGSCRAIRLARLTLDPMTIERLTRRAPAAIINFFDTKDG